MNPPIMIAGSCLVQVDSKLVTWIWFPIFLATIVRVGQTFFWLARSQLKLLLP